MVTHSAILGSLINFSFFVLCCATLDLLLILIVPSQYKKRVNLFEPLLFVLVYGFMYLTSPNLASRRERFFLLAAIVAPILVIGAQLLLLYR